MNRKDVVQHMMNELHAYVMSEIPSIEEEIIKRFQKLSDMILTEALDLLDAEGLNLLDVKTLKFLHAKGYSGLGAKALKLMKAKALAPCPLCGGTFAPARKRAPDPMLMRGHKRHRRTK
jgi:hypothetical protein